MFSSLSSPYNRLQKTSAKNQKLFKPDYININCLFLCYNRVVNRRRGIDKMYRPNIQAYWQYHRITEYFSHKNVLIFPITQTCNAENKFKLDSVKYTLSNWRENCQKLIQNIEEMCKHLIPQLRFQSTTLGSYGKSPWCHFLQRKTWHVGDF